MSKQATPNGNKPVHTVRHRRLQATIWHNQTEQGASFYNVTISRSYKDEQGWHESQSFGYDDLTVVAKLMYDAHSFISAQKAREAGGGPQPRQSAR